MCIGPSGAKYTVLQASVDQYSGLRARLDGENVHGPIWLREVDEDVAHTLIHFLYTGQYQTLPLTSLPDEARVATEFKRSVLTYCAARVCVIEKLEELAKDKIEELSKGLSVFHLQGVTEEVASKLPRKNDWFSTQMNKWIKEALAGDDTLLSEKRFLNAIGGSAIFDRAVVKCLVEMYREQKAKHSTGGGSKGSGEEGEEGEEEEEEEEEVVGSAMNSSIPARTNGIVTHGLQTYISTGKAVDEDVSTDGFQHGKSQQPQNDLGVVTHGLDEGVSKPTAEEISPMPGSEGPSESTFDLRRSSTAKSENMPRPEHPVKATDSEQEPKTKAKKPKKKNRKKGDAAAARQGHDDEAQVAVEE